MAKLIAKSPDLAGQTFELDSPLLTFGRADDNVLVIPHSSVSSHHGEFKLEGKDYRLVDTGSTNGSKVNDAPVTERLLKHGDLVLLGDALFVYESEASVSAQPAPAAPPPSAGERIELGANQTGIGRPVSFVNLTAIGKPTKADAAKFPPLLFIAILIALAGAGWLAYSAFAG